MDDTARNKTPKEGEETLYDFLKGHIGVLDSTEHFSGGAHRSEETGKKFAAGMVERRSRGWL